MPVLLRASACAVLLLGAVLFAGYVLVPWLGGPSLFPDDLREICENLWTEHLRHEALTVRDQSVQQILSRKREIANEVAAGRVTLVEAVVRFRELRCDDGRDETLGAYVSVGDSDEALARSVITHVSTAMMNDPRRDEVLGRLHREKAALAGVEKR
jgi:hypothetical protein